MSYRILRQDFRPENWTAVYAEGLDIDALQSGVRMESVPEPVPIMLSDGGDKRCDFLEQPVFAVSSAMRFVLDRAGIDNIQYFRAMLKFERSQRVEHGFWVANVIGRVSCVDRDASNFESAGDTPGPVLQFEVDVEQTCGLSIFRLAEESCLVLVSSRIQAALQAANLQGLFLQDTRTYDGNLVNTGDHRQVLTISS